MRRNIAAATLRRSRRFSFSAAAVIAGPVHKVKFGERLIPSPIVGDGAYETLVKLSRCIAPLRSNCALDVANALRLIALEESHRVLDLISVGDEGESSGKPAASVLYLHTDPVLPLPRLRMLSGTCGQKMVGAGRGIFSGVLDMAAQALARMIPDYVKVVKYLDNKPPEWTWPWGMNDNFLEHQVPLSVSGQEVQSEWEETDGTAGVALAGLTGAVRAQGRPLTDFVKQKMVVVGAGRGIFSGVLDMAAQALARMIPDMKHIQSVQGLLRLTSEEFFRRLYTFIYHLGAYETFVKLSRCIAPLRSNSALDVARWLQLRKYSAGPSRPNYTFIFSWTYIKTVHFLYKLPPRYTNKKKWIWPGKINEFVIHFFLEDHPIAVKPRLSWMDINDVSGKGRLSRE